ncbi:MAG TPA: ROK family protein [Pyrinomonadaceae bacterium]|nr:ROK family protein [Pyrinomonadaceae bacterium]
MNEIILAADLGGTNLRMAAITPSGEILHRVKVRTPSDDGRESILSTLSDGFKQLEQDLKQTGKVIAFGAAVPATIDASRGHILNSPNLPVLNNFNFAEYFSDLLKVPVLLENDANAAAIGENWKGATKGFQDSICVTLGTGVGGGLILGGRIHRGIDGTAGEVGHITVEPDGIPCGCGSQGCIEQYASARAISRFAHELMPRFPESVLHSDLDITPLDVYNAGVKRDALALEVFKLMGRYLGIALSGLINVLNPEAIVIGGGASAGWDLFIDSLRKEVDYRSFPEPAKRVKLLKSALGDDAGILGAAFLASKELVQPQIPIIQTTV